MKLKLVRQTRASDYTTGLLYINGMQECATLEDKDRGLAQTDNILSIKARKIWGKTAIPTGTYKIEKIYWEKHKRFVPHLIDVKGFQGILIHSGVTANDSSGCVLVGDMVFHDALQNTTAARIRLDAKIFTALEKDEEVTIEII